MYTGVYRLKVSYIILILMKYTLSFTLLRTAGWLFGILLPCSAAVRIFLTENHGPYAFVFALPALPAAALLFFSRHLRYRAAYVDRMSGEQFERYLKYWFHRKGFHHIRTTRRTRDFGADLIMRKGLHRVVVQAKRYDRNIGVHAVQQALAAEAYYHATRAIVVTNQYFTASARKLAEVNDVILLDRQDLFGIAQTRR